MKTAYNMISRTTTLVDQLFPLRHHKLSQDLPMDYGEDLRRELKSIMKDWELSGICQHDVMAGGYALVALVDETVMLSAWPGKIHWAENLLQVEIFGERLAGVQFYERLTTLLQAPDRSLSVLTVYHACLALGFKGQYIVGQSGNKEHMQRLLSHVLLHDMGLQDQAGLSS